LQPSAEAEGCGTIVKMFIGLIGYRGSGKSAVAQLLALKLGCDWVDADVEIEFCAGKSIAAIFADDGEARFRQLESDVLAELVQRENVVAAFGGGVVLNEANRKLLLGDNKPADRKIFWLTASPETLHERIISDAATADRRPNLTAAGGLEEVKRLFAVRESLYRQCADGEIDTENRTAAEVADEIVARVKNQIRPK
jgi:shikimate kinase